MSKAYVINQICPLNEDGSQDLGVEGRQPFHVSAEWLQGKAPAVGDTLTFTGQALTLQSAAVADVQTQTPAQGAPVKQPPSIPQAAQKKTDGGEDLSAGSKSFQPNYRANPVEVEAFEIVDVAGMSNADGSLNLALSNGANVIAHPDMLSRITPALGDYWVVQEDGYVYLNPKAVFERKYAPIAG